MSAPASALSVFGLKMINERREILNLHKPGYFSLLITLNGLDLLQSKGFVALIMEEQLLWITRFIFGLPLPVLDF